MNGWKFAFYSAVEGAQLQPVETVAGTSVTGVWFPSAHFTEDQWRSAVLHRAAMEGWSTVYFMEQTMTCLARRYGFESPEDFPGDVNFAFFQERGKESGSEEGTKEAKPDGPYCAACGDLVTAYNFGGRTSEKHFLCTKCTQADGNSTTKTHPADGIESRCTVCGKPAPKPVALGARSLCIDCYASAHEQELHERRGGH